MQLPSSLTAATAAQPLASLVRLRWACLLCLLALFAVYPALTHDIGATSWDAAGEHIYRGFVFSQSVSEGVLYPRWVQTLHLGLGSPLFTFQPPLPYYALDVLYRLGLPHPIGWRIIIAAGLLAAFAGAYRLVYALTGRRWPAALAAVAYLYAPYVLRNALERGSNEAFSMFLYPWVLWSLIAVARRPRPGRLILAALLWAACIGAHVLGPLMLAPFAGLLALYLAWRHRNLAAPAALLLGGLLTAAIWLPMIPEQAWVHVDRDFTTPEAMPVQNPLSIARLLALPAVYDAQRGNNSTGERIGLLHMAWLALGVPVTIYAWRRAGRRRPLAVALLVATATGWLLFWLFTSASDPAWRALEPFLGRLLYRTRLMGLQALAAALTAGLALALLPARPARLLALLSSALFIVAALPALYLGLLPVHAEWGAGITPAQVRALELATDGRALTAFGEFTPRWHPGLFELAMMAKIGGVRDAATFPLVDPPSGVTITAAGVRSSAWDLAIEATQPATLTLYLLYYPRWQAYLDDRPVTLALQAGTGLAQLQTAAGSHRIRLRYGTTGHEVAGLVISGLALLGICILGAWGWRTRTSRPTVAVAPPGEREPAPSTMLLGGLAILAVFKLFYVDPSTNWLRCASGPQAVCGASTTVDVPFAGGHSLRGYTLDGATAQAGGKYGLTLYWQAAESVRPLRSFVHIRNAEAGRPVHPQTGSDIWAQAEHEKPVGLLTRDSQPGLIYADEFTIALPADMPRGTYFLEVGWFDPATGEQLDPAAEALRPPLRPLWRSVLLPDLTVR